MVSDAQHHHHPTIDVLAKTYRGGVSLRQLAKDLNADPSNVRKAKNWLIENRHPAFKRYAPEDRLNAEQVNTIVDYRSHTTAGIRGDALTEKMFPDIATTHAQKNALRDLFEQANLPPEQAAKLTHSILEIFQQ